MLPVAILAGGLATRLGTLTQCVPKALLRIAGRPFLTHQLEFLKTQGVDCVVLCVGHLGDQVRRLIGDGRTFGLRIEYSFDGEPLRGTGGALKNALPLLGKAFFVLNGDSYLPCSFARVQAAFEAAGQPALMTVLHNENRWDRSNVRVKRDGLVEYDKHSTRSDMSYIDFGLLVLSDGVFSKYPESTRLDLADVCRDLSLSGQLAGMEVSERFYEIGSPRGIYDTEAYLCFGRGGA
jgi:N-acetyl-alpha-D-muramate 1-phosphate uridylyltransferase